MWIYNNNYNDIQVILKLSMSNIVRTYAKYNEY